MYKALAKLIGNTERTIFAWKKEDRPIVNLVQKYFSEDDINEFIETGEITKYHSLNRHQKNIELAFQSIFRNIEDSLDFEGLYYFFKFCNQNYEPILESLLNFNPTMNIGRPTRFNIVLQQKLNEFLIAEKVHEEDLLNDFSEMQVFLFELKYEVRIYLFQSFKTNFKYINNDEIKQYCLHLNNTNTLKEFHHKFIQLREE